MNHKYILVFLLTGILGACATSTNIVPAGKDTYIIAGSDTWESTSGSQIKVSLYQKANSYCQGVGKQLQPLDESVSSYAAELRFRCLSEEDPNYRQPTMESVPNVRIESK